MSPAIARLWLFSVSRNVDSNNNDSDAATKELKQLTSEFGQEKFEVSAGNGIRIYTCSFVQLYCPKRYFISELVFGKGKSKNFWNGTEWDDMKFNIECRPFRTDDKVEER